jgi:hypothetical protein
MAIILDKYAIKEVADVMFYELDSKGAPSAPVLYLDTLKTSTLSQSSEVVDARGGKGNVKLLSWDTNKELTIEMEDAVFSAKSLEIMFGGKMDVKDDRQEVLKTVKGKDMTNEDTDNLSFQINGKKYYIAKGLVTAFSYNDANTEGKSVGNITYGKEVDTPVAIEEPDWANGYGTKTGGTYKQVIEFATFDLLDCTTTKGGSTGIISGGLTIDIGAEFNSNTYYITGDTYARNYQSGKDEFLQFIVPKGKVSAEDVSLTMEADGDPATFSMSVKCLKANDGSMLKLVKYNLGTGKDGNSGLNKGVASVLDQYNTYGERAKWADPVSKIGEGSHTETAADLTDPAN